MVRDIPFASLCEHHMVPFMGRAHVAYIPGSDGRITGLSKLARLVDGFAKRLQVQERMTSQIADAIEVALDPKGVLVVVEAEHLCMSMRGVKKSGHLDRHLGRAGPVPDRHLHPLRGHAVRPRPLTGPLGPVAPPPPWFTLVGDARATTADPPRTGPWSWGSSTSPRTPSPTAAAGSRPDRAIARGLEMIAEGADIVDVGGESTRPGAAVVPVGRGAPSGGPGGRGPQPPGPGVDRHHQGGRGRGGRGRRRHLDQRRVGVAVAGAARCGVGWVAMHRAGTPGHHAGRPALRRCRGRGAGAAGRTGRPGRGGRGAERSGSTRASASARPSTTTSSCWPASTPWWRPATRSWSAPAARAFLGRLAAGPDGVPAPVDDRLPGSLATATWALQQGAGMVRVHDVAATVQAALLVGRPSARPGVTAAKLDTEVGS